MPVPVFGSKRKSSDKKKNILRRASTAVKTALKAVFSHLSACISSDFANLPLGHGEEECPATTGHCTPVARSPSSVDSIRGIQSRGDEQADDRQPQPAGHNTSPQSPVHRAPASPAEQCIDEEAVKKPLFSPGERRCPGSPLVGITNAAPAETRQVVDVRQPKPKPAAHDYLANLGLARHRMRGDGFCLFRTIAHYLGLEEDDGFEQVYLAIRTYMVTNMYQYSRMAGIPCLLGAEGAYTVMTAESMIGHFHWGTEMDMDVASTIFNMEIGVLYEDDGRFECHFPMPGWPSANLSNIFGPSLPTKIPRRALFLYSKMSDNAAAHYDAVRVDPKYAQDGIFAAQQEFIATAVAKLQLTCNHLTIAAAREEAETTHSGQCHLINDNEFAAAEELRNCLLWCLNPEHRTVIAAVEKNKQDANEASEVRKCPVASAEAHVRREDAYFQHQIDTYTQQSAVDENARKVKLQREADKQQAFERQLQRLRKLWDSKVGAPPSRPESSQGSVSSAKTPRTLSTRTSGAYSDATAQRIILYPQIQGLCFMPLL